MPLLGAGSVSRHLCNGGTGQPISVEHIAADAYLVTITSDYVIVCFTLSVIIYLVNMYTYYVQTSSKKTFYNEQTRATKSGLCGRLYMYFGFAFIIVC